MNETDLKYISILSCNFRNFKKKKESLWNFSCPLCGDSKKDKTKARGYLIESLDRSGLFYKCHNCNASLSFKNLIKSVDENLYSQYIFERGIDNRSKLSIDRKLSESVVKLTKVEIDLPRLCDLPKSHPAVVYSKKRNFTLKHLQRLYFVENTRHWMVKNISKSYKDVTNDSRILIPFINENNEIIGAQARSLDPYTNLRYITCKREGVDNLIYGLNYLDKNETVFVVEGALDSLFLPNSIATNNSNLTGVLDYSNSLDYVLIFDNEPKNKEICKCIQKAIDLNLKVCIFPSFIKNKDINEMVMNGVKVIEIIKDNTHKGFSAKVAFDGWKKI